MASIIHGEEWSCITAAFLSESFWSPQAAAAHFWQKEIKSLLLQSLTIVSELFVCRTVYLEPLIPLFMYRKRFTNAEFSVSSEPNVGRWALSTGLMSSQPKTNSTWSLGAEHTGDFPLFMKNLLLLYIFWQGQHLIRESQLVEKVPSDLGSVLLTEITVKVPVMRPNALIYNMHFCTTRL